MLARRLETTRVATFDERHFRIVRPIGGEAAFILKAENGKWTVPAALPCDNPDVPEAVLDNSPCRVS